GDVGPPPARLEGERLGDQPQPVFHPAPRRDVALDLVGKQQEPGAVAIFQRGKDQQRGDLGRNLRLRLRREPRVLRSRAVDGDQRRQLALPVKTLTNGSPIRAVTFQSIDRISSPGWYGRTSEKAIPRPLNTEWYPPASVSCTARLVVISMRRIFRM